MSPSTAERLAVSGRFAVHFVLAIAFAQQAHAATELDQGEGRRSTKPPSRVRETLLDIGDWFPTVDWRVLEQVPGRVRVHARHPGHSATATMSSTTGGQRSEKDLDAGGKGCLRTCDWCPVDP